MKILVTGVKGQLGFDVVNELEQRGHTAIGVDIEEMDITNKESVNTVIHGANPDDRAKHLGHRTSKITHH